MKIILKRSKITPTIPSFCVFHYKIVLPKVLSRKRSDRKWWSYDNTWLEVEEEDVIKMRHDNDTFFNSTHVWWSSSVMDRKSCHFTKKYYGQKRDLTPSWECIGLYRVCNLSIWQQNVHRTFSYSADFSSTISFINRNLHEQINRFSSANDQWEQWKSIGLFSYSVDFSSTISFISRNSHEQINRFSSTKDQWEQQRSMGLFSHLVDFSRTF